MTRILIIDDDRTLALQKKELLEIYGHTVTVAFSISDGEKAFRNRQADIVIIDIQFNDTPDINGIDLYQRIKDIQQHVKFIIWSGTENEQDIRILESFPDVTFLQKGVDTEVLLEVIQKIEEARNAG